MKTLHIIALLLIGSTVFGQLKPEDILASNEINSGKSEQTVLAQDFQKMNANKLDGIYKILSDKGTLLEVRTFEKGKLDGTWLQYDKNENLIAIANYKNDKKHGKWVIWDSNGTKRYELFYENGNRKGTWNSWDENGKLISTTEY